MADPVPAAGSLINPMVALLCLSDASGDRNVALTQVFGRPFIHHLIKSLQEVGISRIFIGTDTVPGSLLSYCDAARQEGLDVNLVRNPVELTGHIETDALVLIQSADTIWNSELIKMAIGERRPLVAVVEERTENQAFERIDLNNRWAGLALIERRSIDALQELPDGWDMASSLMRRALQDGLPLWAIRQTELQSGAVQKIDSAVDMMSVAAAMNKPPVKPKKSAEDLLFGPIVGRILPHCWTAPWARTLAEWAFPTTAAATTILSYFEMPLSAIFLAIASIFTAHLRKAVHHAEYRNTTDDWIAGIGWVLMAASLGLMLYQGFETAPEAAYLSVLLAMIAIHSVTNRVNSKIWLSSPLTVTLVLLWGQIAGLVGWSIRLLILSQIALLLLPLIKARSPDNQT
jgi:hypothetical protein